MTQTQAAVQVSDPKWEFLDDVFLSNSRRDAFQIRGGRCVYVTPKIRDEQGWRVAKEFNIRLRDIAALYVSSVEEEKHIENIRTLANGVSGACSDLLNENRLVFGVAQKALNSYLKYLWCAGRIEMPPHCPFDDTIIGKLKLSPACGTAWTYGTETDYRAWISAAKDAAGERDETLAEWELREWGAQVNNTRIKPAPTRF